MEVDFDGRVKIQIIVWFSDNLAGERFGKWLQTAFSNNQIDYSKNADLHATRVFCCVKMA